MQIGLITHLPANARRCFRRSEAASYAGISPSMFDKLVRDGRMPEPMRLDRCKVWDVRALDRAIDALTGAEVKGEENSWDDVLQ